MLYIITGPAGVGKSTISKFIAKNLSKSCLIEGDDIYPIVVGGYVSPWKEGNQLDLFWKNSFDLIKNCLDDGYDVVFNYIVKNKAIDNIKKKFKQEKIKYVILICDEKTIVERDKLREPQNQMKERSIILLNEFKKLDIDKKFFLDSSTLTEQQVVDKILCDDRFLL